MTHGADFRSPVRISQAALDNARSRFELARGEFRDTEDQFLKILDEIWHTDNGRITNLAKLEGFRMQLMASFDSLYRKAVNNLVDALLTSIGEPERPSRDGASAPRRTQDGASSTE